jgi:hypothetical protein
MNVRQGIRLGAWNTTLIVLANFSHPVADYSQS